MYSHGGKIETNKDALNWAKEAYNLGAGELLVTSIDQDGQQSGYDNELLKNISDNVQIPVIASGGAGKLEHFNDAFKYGKADAVLAASLFHFRKLRIFEVKEYLRNNGFIIRK